MSRKSPPVVLSEAELSRLDQWIRAGSTPQQVVLRARIIRDAAAGRTDKMIAASLAVRRETAALWRRRVREQGIGCVWEIAPGRGRKPHYDATQVGQWVAATLQTKPAGATHTYAELFEGHYTSSWQFASMEQVAANRAVARLKDKELEAQIRQRANAPLVVILKHPEPHDDLNPSVQVMVRPLGQLEGKSPVELMNLVAPNIQRAMADFTFVEQIQETKLAGMPAAYLKAKYTVANPGGREFKTLSRMWIIPRGSFMFMISASGPQDGPDVSETEFRDILDSIKIDQ